MKQLSPQSVPQPGVGPTPASPWFSRIRLARYAANGCMHPHRHAEASLCLLTDGRYEERIRGRSAWHAAGEMMFCPADEPHAQVFAGEGALKILFDVRAGTLDYLGGRIALAEAPATGSARLASIARRLRTELRANPADAIARLAVEGLALEALAEFGRRADRQAPREPWLARARDYVHAHACDGFSMDDMARAVGRHPVHVARMFRTAFGSSVGEMVRALRLAEAARRLRDTRQPIARIAAECGFTDQAHLTRRFREAHGTTPARFRRDRR